MGLLDFLSDVGRVASPGLEAYGQGRVGAATLRENRKIILQKVALELDKEAEQRRQFGVTSGISQATLNELIRHQGTTEEITKAKEKKITPGEAQIAIYNPALFAILHPEFSSGVPINKPSIFSRGAKAVGNFFSGNAEATPVAIPPSSTSPTPSTPTETLGLRSKLSKTTWLKTAKSIPGIPVETLIKDYKTEYPDTTDEEVRQYFGIPTTPSASVSVGLGQVGYGPLSQGNPQGGLASLSESPIDFQQYFPPKEELLPRLRQIPSYLQQFAENRRGGPIDIQQYIPRKGHTSQKRSLGTAP